MGVWPKTSPSVVSPGLKDSGSNGSVDKCGSEIYLCVKEGSSFRLTFQDVAFNTFKTIFKFSILSQLCFYAHNRAADRTVSVQPKSFTDSHQRL
jgi:hypothetical protein